VSLATCAVCENEFKTTQATRPESSNLSFIGTDMYEWKYR
jgi:hypothetical protein